MIAEQLCPARGPDAKLHAEAGAEVWLPPSFYRFIWRATARDQIRLWLMTLLVVPLLMVPLELQRQMTNEAIGHQDVQLLLQLGTVYIIVMLAQGGLK
jgi:hypothetical protein